jgi:DNA repair protein RecO (recombination protein O)
MRSMPVLATDALVLRTYKLGESSRIVVLLTRERGKLRAVAKGARGPRSRYQSALETLSEVRATLYGRQGAELLRLGSCELLRSAFPARSRSLDAGLALSYYAELLDGFAQEGEAEDAVYRLAVAVVRAGEAGADAAVLARYLEAWLLRLHGLYPPIDACASCGRPLVTGALRYHAAARGFVCDDCGPAAGPALPAEARAFLVDVFRQAPAALQGPLPAEAAVLEPFHQELITHHLERALKSQRVLKEIARETGR